MRPLSTQYHCVDVASIPERTPVCLGELPECAESGVARSICTSVMKDRAYRMGDRVITSGTAIAFAPERFSDGLFAVLNESSESGITQSPKRSALVDDLRTMASSLSDVAEALEAGL